MLSKCGKSMDLFLMVSESLYFVILVADDSGSLVCTSSSFASPSIIVGASMNLHTLRYRLCGFR